MRAVRHFFISELVNMEALKAKAGDLIDMVVNYSTPITGSQL
jgi:hypothetical protein